MAAEIESLGADVLCLQEVRDGGFCASLLRKTRYAFSCFSSHPNEAEGLAIFSKVPISESRYASKSVLAALEFGGFSVLLANVHLTWSSALQKEREIVEIVRNVNRQAADYKFILGDFNCSPNSSVQRFLLGEQSLLGEEANPFWCDLAESYSGVEGALPELTVGFRRNPRWGGGNTIEANQRFDRILLMNPYPAAFPRLVRFGTFGKTEIESVALSPIDHWGVFCDLEDFKEE